MQIFSTARCSPFDTSPTFVPEVEVYFLLITILRVGISDVDQATEGFHGINRFVDFVASFKRKSAASECVPHQGQWPITC